MRRSRVQYIFTWVTLGFLIFSGLGLMALSWNGAISGSPSPGLMVMLWVIMMASGIYLFMLAVKKAHRLWVDDERRIKLEEEEEKKAAARVRTTSRKDKALDVSSAARRLVRRIPADEPLAKSGQVLLKNLAIELEIMSGVFYIRENNEFNAVATYASALPTEPYSFREGEGLTGQAAANQKMMVLTTLPEGYREVFSGLGKSQPSYLAIVPIVLRNQTLAVLECSGYRYEADEIEAMFRVFARDLTAKISPKL